VSPTSGVVLLVHSGTQPSRAAESDLALAGFEVVSVTDGRALVEAARRHLPAAIVLGRPVDDASWRRWTRDPASRGVPVVLLTRGRPKQVAVPWPAGAFVRADAHVSAADLKRRGAAADAVRAAIARGDRAPTTRLERLGEALWHVGSVLDVVGLLVAIVGVAFTLTSGARGVLWGMPLLAVGNVLLDVGGRVGVGQRPGLRWQSWVWIAFAVGAVWVLVAEASGASFGAVEL
jgi:hypothetical protein